MLPESFVLLEQVFFDFYSLVLHVDIIPFIQCEISPFHCWFATGDSYRIRSRITRKEIFKKKCYSLLNYQTVLNVFYECEGFRAPDRGPCVFSGLFKLITLPYDTLPENQNILHDDCFRL